MDNGAKALKPLRDMEARPEIESGYADLQSDHQMAPLRGFSAIFHVQNFPDMPAETRIAAWLPGKLDNESCRKQKVTLARIGACEQSSGVRNLERYATP